jgi:hypothetical protein
MATADTRDRKRADDIEGGTNFFPRGLFYFPEKLRFVTVPDITTNIVIM